MALIKKAVDTVNKRVQFPISESCSGISYEFTGGEDIEMATISVILIEENEPNKVLYKFQKNDLFQILKFNMPRKDKYLAFSLNGDLSLSKTKSILVEFDFDKGAEAPTEIQYETVISPNFSDTHLQIKTISADGGEIEFSNENYNLLRIPATEVSNLNANLIVSENGKTMPKLVRYTQQYFGSITVDRYASLVLPNDTKISATANSAIHLVKF